MHTTHSIRCIKTQSQSEKIVPCEWVFRVRLYWHKRETESDVAFRWLHRQECIPVGCVPSAAVTDGGVCLPWGMYPSMHWGRHPLPRLQNSWHMLVKTLPFRNYVADGKNPNNVHIEQRQRPTKRIRFRAVYYRPLRVYPHRVSAAAWASGSGNVTWRWRFKIAPHPQFPSFTMYSNAADARCGLTINAQVVLHFVWTFVFSVISPMVGPDFKAISPLNETITWICETFRGETLVRGFKWLNTYTLRNHGDKRVLNAHLHPPRENVNRLLARRARTSDPCAEMSVTIRVFHDLSTTQQCEYC